MSNKVKKTILFLENEPVTEKVTVKTLKSFGYNVVVARTGEDAVSMVLSDKTIDLVLSDIDLGDGIDGPEAATQILEKRKIPIVFHTSHNEKEYVDRVKKITRYGYVVKNSGAFVLQSSIEMAFELFDAHTKTEASENRSHKLADSSFEAIFFSRDGICVNQNSRAQDMFGYTLEEAIGKAGTDWIHPQCRGNVMKKMQIDDIRPYEAIALRKDGTTFPCEIQAKTHEDEEGILRITALRDISDRKDSAEELYRYQQMMTIVDDSFSFVDTNYIYRTVNEAYSEFLDKPREEIIDHSIAELLGDEIFTTEIKPQFDRCLAGEEIHYQLWVDFPTMGRCFMDMHYYPARDLKGDVNGVIAHGRNMTEMKDIQDQLEQTNRALNAAFESTSDSFVLIAPDYSIIALNSTTTEITRKIWNRDVEVGDSILDYSTEADVESFKANFARAIKGERIEVEKELSFPGKTLWFLVHYIPVKDEHGKIMAVSFTSTDITAKKHNENELKQSEENYRTIFNKALVPIIKVEPPGDLIQVNEKACTLFGYSSDEMLSIRVEDLVHPDNDSTEEDQYIEQVLSGTLDNYEVEKKFIHKNGNIIWGILNSTVVRNDMGEIMYAIGVISDITDIRELDIISRFLMVEHENFNAISDYIIDKLKSVVNCKDGYAATMDKVTGNLVVHSFTNMMGKNCSIEGDALTTVFTPGDNNQFMGLYGACLNTSKSFYTNDPSSHPESKGVPKGHIPIENFLTVPAIVDGTVVGQLALANKETGFVDHDLKYVEAVAGIYALAVQRMMTNNELLESKRQFQDVVETSADFIWEVNGQSVYTYASPAVELILGYSPVGILGMSASDLMDSETAEMYRNDFQRMKDNREPIINREIAMKAKNGTRVVLESNAMPILDHRNNVIGYRGIDRDITLRKAQEEKLTRYMTAIEQSRNSIVITDKNGIIEYANPWLYELTGYSPQELWNKTPRELKSGNMPDSHYKQLWETILSGKVWKGEFENKKKNGELFWESATISPIRDNQGNITHFVAVKEDITLRKETEQLKEDIERITRHDLKNPLNVIISVPSMVLEEERLSDEGRELVELIQESGVKMLEMLNMSLDMYKMEAGVFQYQPIPLDLFQSIAHVVHGLNRSVKGSDDKIVLCHNGGELDQDEQKPVVIIKGDNLLLYSALNNLIMNALEATTSPGEKVTIDIIEKKESVDIAIHNPGVIPDRVKDHFFDKYVTHGKKGGTGLGTYSSNLIVTTMGGTITFTSTESQGTTVTVHMPVPRD